METIEVRGSRPKGVGVGNVTLPKWHTAGRDTSTGCGKIAPFATPLPQVHPANRVPPNGLVGVAPGNAFRVPTRKHTNVIRNAGDLVKVANESHRESSRYFL